MLSKAVLRLQARLKIQNRDSRLSSLQRRGLVKLKSDRYILTPSGKKEISKWHKVRFG